MSRPGRSPRLADRAGEFIGQSVWDTESVIRNIDPRMVGYCFDPAEATAEGGLGGWAAALRLALPRLKAVTLQDFYWKKDADAWKMQRCPLGEGMVDWQKFFTLSDAKFTGPTLWAKGPRLRSSLAPRGRHALIHKPEMHAARGRGGIIPCRPSVGSTRLSLFA